MEIRVLGAHNIETSTTRLTSLLVDDTLVVDAGGLTSSLSLEEQLKVTSILVTHCHYDHIRDIAAIGLGISYFDKRIDVYSLAETLDVISGNILNGVIYPKFHEIPTPDRPPLAFHPLEVHKTVEIDGYEVIAVPVQHAVTSVGFQINSQDGKSVFCSGDTGPGLARCCERISPQLVMTEVTLPNRMHQHGISTGHLTPQLLADELILFRKDKGYLPRVVALHMAPMFEDEIKGEVDQVSRELGATITVGYEGMKLTL
jgi:ribonuclease BN (tRNA processing enzyme)